MARALLHEPHHCAREPAHLTRQRFVLIALSAACSVAGCPVWAAAAAPTVGGTAPLLFAAPSAHPVMPGQAGSLIRVVIALLLVLAAVFAAAWFSRRMHGVGNARHSALEVLAQLSLGPRERAVLVRVGSQQVLLGVASGNVRALHVLPEGAATANLAPPAVETEQRMSFKAALLRSLGK